VIALLPIYHELKLGELLCHGQHLLFVDFLVALKQGPTGLLAPVERILPEVGRVAHSRRRVVHVWVHRAIILSVAYVCGAATRIRHVVRVPPRVLGQVFREVRPGYGSSEALGPRCKLGHFIFSQFLKNRVTKQLRCCVSLVGVVNEHF